MAKSKLDKDKAFLFQYLFIFFCFFGVEEFFFCCELKSSTERIKIFVAKQFEFPIRHQTIEFHVMYS